MLFSAFFALPIHQVSAQKLKTTEIAVSEGITIQLPQPAQTIFIADPNIADIQAPSNTTIFMFGKRPGKTTLFALDENGNKIISHNIIVFQPLDDVRKLLKTELGNETVILRPTPGGVVMSGTVTNPEVAETAKTLVTQSLGSGTALINRLKIAGKMQVSLHVRVIEVARSINKELNLNWNSMGDLGQVAIIGGTQIVNGKPGIGNENCCKNKNILQTIDDLAAGGLISVLAEPNLTAVSGESASFLAGGEFPIPVTQGQNGAVTIQYQSYGVGLDFVPTVLSDDLISIRVKPEVSEMASQTVSSGNMVVPYMTTRRAQTTVELGSGQSFAIGGLIRKTSTKSVAPATGFERIPLIGGLFRGTSHAGNIQRSDSELVIIVTPYIVRPATGKKVLQAPYVTEKTSIAVPVAPPEQLYLSQATKQLPAPPPQRFAKVPLNIKTTIPVAQLQKTAREPAREPVCAAKHRTMWQLRDGPSLPSSMPLGSHCGSAPQIITGSLKAPKPVVQAAPVQNLRNSDEGEKK